MTNLRKVCKVVGAKTTGGTHDDLVQRVVEASIALRPLQSTIPKDLEKVEDLSPEDAAIGRSIEAGKYATKKKGQASQASPGTAAANPQAKADGASAHANLPVHPEFAADCNNMTPAMIEFLWQTLTQKQMLQMKKIMVKSGGASAGGKKASTGCDVDDEEGEEDDYCEEEDEEEDEDE
jgi:hypothetical protein